MIDPESVDRVLLQVGKIGRFQLINHVLLNLPILFSALYTIAYVFTAQDLTYRCLIPECEDAAKQAEFLPTWLSSAVPFSGGLPDSCNRYGHNGSRTECSDFDSSSVERCHRWRFQPGQRSTIVSEWDLTCEENKWMLSFVGTIGYIGAFIGMPLAGFISDRFGRRTLLICSWTLASLSGLIQSFASGYVMFVVFEFCDSFFETGVYGAGFLLALEFVGPEQRVLATTVLSMFYSSGNALLGAIAWGVQDWRWLLRVVYGGGLACGLPLLFTPESVRWLAARGRLEEGDAVVARVAAMNGVQVTETLVGIARSKGTEIPSVKEAISSEGSEGISEEGTFHSIGKAFRSRILLLRFLNCAYCWVANTFVYYGLSLNAVTLSGNEYVNFILSGLVELPANLLALWLQDWLGRRWTQAGSLIVAGVSCLAFIAIPQEEQWLAITVYMLGKFAITISFIVVYVITAEMFPTNVRQSMVSYGSTFGRIGSMLAPQTPLLASINSSLPLTLFGVVSLTSGLLALRFPETKGRPLPETVKEAEEMDSHCLQCVI